MSWEKLRREPLYVRVKGALRDYLDAHPGETLPGERELCRELGVSRGTLRQAISQLTLEGRLQPQHGRGTMALNLPPAGGNRRILFAVDADLPVYESELFHEMLRQVYQAGMEALTMVLRPVDLGSEMIARVLCQVDAVVLTVRLAKDEEVGKILRHSGRRALVMRYAVDGYATVTDNRAAAYELLVDHLIALGHRQLAFLGVFRADPERRRGVMTALERAGIAWNDDMMVESAGSRAQGYRDTEELLRRGKDFTAVVCQNDEHALGVMERLLEAGLKIPRDVSIVGFDNIAASADYPVPLTTCGADLSRMARESFRFLLAAPDDEVGRLELDPGLVIRRSSGPVPVDGIYEKIRR